MRTKRHLWGSRSDTEVCKNQKWICDNSKKKHRICRQLVLCGSPCSACVGWSLMTICVEWQFLCGLVEGEKKKKPDKQHPPGASQADFVTTAERQPCEFVFVHRACLWGKTPAVIFAVGLLVLKEQIPVRRQVADMLQSMTLTMEWITYWYCSECRIPHFIIFHYYPWRICISMESLDNCNNRARANVCNVVYDIITIVIIWRWAVWKAKLTPNTVWETLC